MYRCDYDDEEITGDLYEACVTNPYDRTDTVCVMWSCRRHARRLAAHTRRWWERWLEGEGALLGYRSLS